MNFDFPLLEVADDLTISQAQGVLRLTRTAQGIYVQGKFGGTEPTQCVRCLTDFTQKLQAKFDQQYEYPPNAKADFVVEETGFMDVAPFLREDLILARSMRPLCKPMCKGLCPQCGTNWNEASCNCAAEETNPQWAVLKNLRKDKES